MVVGYREESVVTLLIFLYLNLDVLRYTLLYTPSGYAFGIPLKYYIIA